MTKTEENQPDLGEEGVLDTVEPEAEQETKSKKRKSESDEMPRDGVSTKKRKIHLWDDCYAGLVVYQSSHGHCNVSHKDDPHLAEWVSAQRKRREGSDKQVACARPLHPFQVERLNAIGFVWDTDQTGTEEDEAIERQDDTQVTHDEVIDNMPKHRGGRPFDHTKWKQMYELLSEYKQIHGDCLVGNDHEKLAMWVMKQRQVYRNGKLLSGREKLLNDLGFCWDPRITTDTDETETEEDETLEHHDDCDVVLAEVNDGMPKRRGGSQPDDAKWIKMYESLSEYKRVHGDCLVRCNGNQKTLGNWVTFHRYLHREGRLRSDRKKLLDEIGFCWDPPPRKSGGGHRKSSGAVQHKTVSERVAKMPSKVAAKTSAGDRAELPIARGEDVVQVNDSTSKCKQADHAKWKKKYELLLEYKRIHGDCLVRQDHKILGNWVHWQRQVHRNGKLLGSRKKLLDEIGFCWVAPHNKPDREPQGNSSGTLRQKMVAGRVAKRPAKGAADRIGTRSNKKPTEDDSGSDEVSLVDPENEDDVACNSDDERREADFGEDLRGRARLHSGETVQKARRILRRARNDVQETRRNEHESTEESVDINGIINVTLSPRTKRTQGGQFNNAKWMNSYKQLVELKRKNGNCIIGWNDRDLFNWARRQRKQNRNGRLPADRKQLLIDIGFPWNPPDQRFRANRGMDTGDNDTRDKKPRAKQAAQALPHEKAKYSIGTKVQKLFQGHGWFTGEIKSYDGDYYTVTYADGDREEYDDKEIEEIVCTTPDCGDKTSTRGQNKYAIGTAVRKNFVGHGWFNGSVTDYDEPLYGVTYEDGDKEGLSEDALTKIVVKPDPAKIKVGSRVAIHWPRDGKFYEGTVVDERKHKKPWRVEYDGGTHEWLNFHWRRFHLLSHCESRLSKEETSNDRSHEGSDCDLSEVGVGSRLSVYCDQAN